MACLIRLIRRRALRLVSDLRVGLRIGKRRDTHVDEGALELLELLPQALMVSRPWIGSLPLAS